MPIFTYQTAKCNKIWYEKTSMSNVRHDVSIDRWQPCTPSQSDEMYVRYLRSTLSTPVNAGATSVHVTKHLYEVRLRDLVYMKSIYMK